MTRLVIIAVLLLLPSAASAIEIQSYIEDHPDYVEGCYEIAEAEALPHLSRGGEPPRAASTNALETRFTADAPPMHSRNWTSTKRLSMP